MDELKAPSLQSLLESDHGSTDSLLAESLHMEVEDLDDAEYSIPATAVLPSLESVLSEFEGDSDVASEYGVPPPPTPTPSSIADDGIGGVRGGGAGGGGSIMRYATLQGVSAQISSAADRVNAGLATACAVSALIAVGTSHGHILNFDVTQTLRWAHQDKHGQGAVSTLAFNPDCTRLLAGYARGQVIMIDTKSGDVLRYLHDAATPNTGVLHVKWTSRSALALCADSGGSVWSLSFTRKLGIRGCSSRCLFSGARGEVCAVEPLIIDRHGATQHHDLDQYCIVALATLSKYFIVTIRPRLKVIKYHALQGPPDCLPVLAWQMVLIQAADTTRSVDPVLVVGRGNQLYFHQLFVSNGRITLLYLRYVQLQANLLSAHWLGAKCVGCLDTAEILHLIDVRSSKELECIDLANSGLVYSSAHFKGLATGGNVSPALALAGTHACYNSLASRGTQLYVLGARSLHMIGVRTWTERISYLVKNQRWQEACDLALDGYRLAAERPKRRALAKERIVMLFKDYLAASAHAPDYCLGSIVECLIVIGGELDLLWTQLWERLQNRNLFLKHVSEHIENERIRRINPVISQALVDYWLQISPHKLEEVVLKLEWTCLDLNQVLRAAKRHRLYRAQIYLNTHALHDYTISLTELIPLVVTEHSDLGNSVLVYISSCLAGRGYPCGDIPAELVQNVKHDVLRCLTSPHSTASQSDELPYPYLRALLKFDTRETLNVISLAFQEKEFNGELGFSHRKRIINILLEIMTPENTAWAEIGCLLNFIAQQISLQCLPRDTQLLEKVLDYLAREDIVDESARQHSEREGAWHELLANNCLSHISSDEEQLLLARRARCYYVEEYLLEKLRCYDRILDCYVNNGMRHEMMFGYMERHAQQVERQIYQQLRTHLQRLLQINAEETTRLVDTHYREQIAELLEQTRLGGDERLLYIFLQHLHKRNTPLTAEQSELFVELLCVHGGASDELDTFLRSTDVYRTDRTLAVVQRHKQSTAAIYLYEKDLNYGKAFELLLELVNSAQAAGAAAFAQQAAEFCVRASHVVSAREREEYWFALLRLILSRADLKSITKSMLHEASQHVDLRQLVQLVMSTRNVSAGFGDIKELLLSMLSQARHDTLAMATTAQILGTQLHGNFAQRRYEAYRGRWVTMMRCVYCQARLYNQTRSVVVLGICGHAMHEQCTAQYAADQNDISDEDEADNDDSKSGQTARNSTCCPRCRTELQVRELRRPLQLSQPSRTAIGGSPRSDSIRELGVLQLKAPPRRY